MSGKSKRDPHREAGKLGLAADEQERLEARTVPFDDGRIEKRVTVAADLANDDSSVSQSEVSGSKTSRIEISLDGPQCAADVMTDAVKTVPLNVPLASVATLMRDENVGIVPVVDEERHLLGVITDRDIVVRVDAEAAPVDLVRAGDVMTVNPITVLPDEDLHVVIDRLGAEGLHRILVADAERRLLGIISVSDLARRTDLPERIQDTIEQIARHRS
jgi:CBS domain-containing protein